MERRCKASWDHLKVIAKHEMKPALKQKMSDFLKDCAERIIILKIVHRRIINRSAMRGSCSGSPAVSPGLPDVSLHVCRFHAFLLFLGHPVYAARDVSVHRFSKVLSEFALEYRTTRERVLQQKLKRANHRERNKTRGKMITDVSPPHQQHPAAHSIMPSLFSFVLPRFGAVCPALLSLSACICDDISSAPRCSHVWVTVATVSCLF